MLEAIHKGIERSYLMTETDRLELLAAIHKGVEWRPRDHSHCLIACHTFSASASAMAVCADGYFLAAFSYNSSPTSFSTLAGCMLLYGDIPRWPAMRVKLCELLEEFAPSVQLTLTAGSWCLNGTRWLKTHAAIVVFDAASNDDRAQGTVSRIQSAVKAYGQQCLTFSMPQPPGKAWIPAGPMTLAEIGARAGVT